jgi:hypothetical protein
MMKVWVMTSHTGHGEGFEVAGVFSTPDAAKRVEPSEQHWYLWAGAWHNHERGEQPVDTGVGRAYITIQEYEVED